jgi:hypothetical protein
MEPPVGQGRNFRAILPLSLTGDVPLFVSGWKKGESLMSDYRRAFAHEFEPMIDWRALLVLSSFLSVGICAGMMILLSV